MPGEELHRFHNERVAAVDAQLLGRRLYETMLVWGTGEFPDPVMAEFAEVWRSLEKVVFSTTLTSVEGSNRLSASRGRGTLSVGGLYSLRVGSYRILYQLTDDGRTVRVAAIRHRGTAYRGDPR